MPVWEVTRHLGLFSRTGAYLIMANAGSRDLRAINWSCSATKCLAEASASGPTTTVLGTLRFDRCDPSHKKTSNRTNSAAARVRGFRAMFNLSSQESLLKPSRSPLEPPFRREWRRKLQWDRTYGGTALNQQVRSALWYSSQTTVEITPNSLRTAASA